MTLQILKVSGQLNLEDTLEKEALLVVTNMATTTTEAVSTAEKLVQALTFPALISPEPKKSSVEP